MFKAHAGKVHQCCFAPDSRLALPEVMVAVCVTPSQGLPHACAFGRPVRCIAAQPNGLLARGWAAARSAPRCRKRARRRAGRRFNRVLKKPPTSADSRLGPCCSAISIPTGQRAHAPLCHYDRGNALTCIKRAESQICRPPACLGHVFWRWPTMLGSRSGWPPDLPKGSLGRTQRPR